MKCNEKMEMITNEGRKTSFNHYTCQQGEGHLQIILMPNPTD